jgi:hypothetical protein
MKNTIDIIVSDDGRVIIKTSSIASADHILADRMLSELPALLGSESVQRSRLQSQASQHQHQHHHSHEHEH